MASLLIAAALTFSVWVGLNSFATMIRWVRYRHVAGVTVLGRRLLTPSIGLIIAAGWFLVTWEATEGTIAKAVFIQLSDDNLSDEDREREVQDESGRLRRERHREATRGLLAPLDLFLAELAVKPADWLNKDTAEQEFRKSWCARRDLGWAMCARKPDSVQRAARTAWCEETAVATALDEDRLNCEGWFKNNEAELIAEWEERRVEYLSIIDKPNLAGRDLREANLAAAFLPRVNLSGARMEGANFVEARMEGAIFFGARMEGAFFIEARMEGANFVEARMEGANLSRAQMEGANLSRAEMEGANLSEARMEGADLSGARMEGADLSGARMEGADLTAARMEGADLSWARMEGADLTAARMEGADLLGARMEGADLRDARMEGADLTAARMEGADLRDARMEGADLTAARMEGAKFLSADFSGATISASLLNSADFTGAKGMTQSMLADAVGDADTILPKDAETGAQLTVPSCWPEMKWHRDFYVGSGLYTEAEFDAIAADVVCAVGETPQPTGRPAN